MHPEQARTQIHDYLKTRFKEPEPSWLQLADRLGEPDVRRQFLEGFLTSRIVYYPGAGSDGQPVHLFNKTHTAHAFIHVDQWTTRKELETMMTPAPGERRRGFRGYRKLAVCNLAPSELAPYPLRAHAGWHEVAGARTFVGKNRDYGYAVLYVFERLPEFGDDHGAKRFALIYLKADGFAAYDALFCQRGSIARPFCVVVQDHAFGGNWNQWDRGGLLEGIATRAGVRPPLLLVAHSSREWEGYRPSTHNGLPLHQVFSPSYGFWRRLCEQESGASFHPAPKDSLRSWRDSGAHRPVQPSGDFYFYWHWPEFQQRINPASSSDDEWDLRGMKPPSPPLLLPLFLLPDSIWGQQGASNPESTDPADADSFPDQPGSN
jgi:hypothetical protein